MAIYAAFTNPLSLSLDSVSLTIYSIYKPSGDSKHDQGRHRQRSVEDRGHHQGQSRGGGRRGIRRHADLHATRRTHRTARLRRVPGEAAEARHRPQPADGQGSPDSSGPHHPFQAGQRPPEYRVVDPVLDDPESASPPAFAWPTRKKFQDRGWLHVLL